ncbi:unnamed protein product [Calicophoron daubneyi]|uniref:B30.2/SPRY domain-containing protein n=1 Tax=Calicophoron daubneyi TaxID=300641 RepID=A0AAV2T3W1_CALDB
MALPRYSEKVGREIDEYALRVYKSDSHSPGFQRLPRCWNAKDRSRCLRLSHFALTVTYSGGFTERHDSNYSNHEPACVRADTPVPLTTGIYYFEITVAHKGNNGRSVSIGFSTKSASLAKLPGTLKTRTLWVLQ